MNTGANVTVAGQHRASSDEINEGINAMTRRLTVQEVIALMQRSGDFYLRVRPGLRPALWTHGHRLGARLANRDQLADWLENHHEAENPYSLATTVMQREWTDEFAVVDEETLPKVNAAISELGRKHRAKAVEILGRYGAMTTSQLKHEDYLAVLDAATKELAKLDTAAA
jgi:hypothetical protein